MNNESYLFLIWKNLWTSFSAITGTGGLFFSFVFWIFKPEQKISLFSCIIILSILLFILQLFIRLSIALYNLKKRSCNIIYITEPYGNFKSDNDVILLTSYVDYFTENGIVSIFHLENGFERQIALGQIINIQEDKKVQILMFNIDKEFSRERLLKNEPDFNKKLNIKPIVKFNSLEVIYNGK